MAKGDNLIKATIFALFAALLYALLAILIKITTKDAPTEMIVFFRQFFSLITLTPLLFWEYSSKNQSLKTRVFPLFLLRAFASLSGMYCLFYALKYLPVVDALTLSYTRPLFIPFVIWIWFRKKVRARTWWGLAIGFLGVLFIIKPQNQVFNFATLVGLGSGLFGAIAFTSVRKLTKTESPTAIVFYYLILSMPIAVLPAISVFFWPSWQLWGLLFVIGLLGTFYQTFLTLGYKYAHTSKVSSILYAAVIFGAMLDWWFFQLIPDWITIIGILLICFGSLFVVRDRKTAIPNIKK